MIAVTEKTLKDWLILAHANIVRKSLLLYQKRQNIRSVLEELRSDRHLKLSEKQLTALKKPDHDAIQQELAWQTQPHCHIICWEDTRYPSLLREISSPPLLLYVQGDPAWLKHPQIAMIGARNASHCGLETARNFGRTLGQLGWVITSGLALGIDAESHRGCLESTQGTVAVLGSGLNHIYPKRHQKLARQITTQGALVSEFPINAIPRKEWFPRRNRLISGLSRGVLVVEASLRSGSLITARYAAEQGREVFVIPHTIYHRLAKGCHQLLREGAILVERPEEIPITLMPILDTSDILDYKPESVSSLRPKLKRLLQCIDYETVTSADRLAARTQWTTQQVCSLISELELQGYVRAVTGGYVRCVSSIHE